MPKFKVRLLETVSYDIVVECESEEFAKQKAAEIWADSDDPYEKFGGTDYGVEPQYVEEVTENTTETVWIGGHPVK